VELQRTRVAAKKGVIQQLAEIAGRLPESRVKVKLPEWLRDPSVHKEACEEEASLYQEIEALVRQMSDARERGKSDLLLKLSREHNLVLAFDSHLITLADLRHRLELLAEGNDLEVIVATGETHGARRRLYRAFRPGSGARGIVALCSDALAEGVNLQEASVVVMLDMPSVIRVAEQRIGRVDRMNSPHDSVHAYWPLDPPGFALRASERLAERNRFVHDHLGANLQLPEEFDATIDYKRYVAEIENSANRTASDDELQDAFSAVRGLVDGDQAIVASQVYEELRRSKARVVSAVSVVKSDAAFAFLAIAGTEWGAPRWVYLSDPASEPTTDLDLICSALRSHLTSETIERQFDSAAAEAITRVLGRLRIREEVLLPRAKQRALIEMRLILSAYRKQSAGDDGRLTILKTLLEMASGEHNGQAVDLATLADWWLRLIQPVKFRHLSARARRRPVLLRDLRADLTQNPLDTEQLQQAFDATLLGRPIDERVVAAIIGVP
jgi:hypothetical protein